MPDTPTEWSLKKWQELHDTGYFEGIDGHRNWAIYDHIPYWLQEIAPPERTDLALEIGAGYGEWMIPMVPYVEHVTGIDLHPKLVQVALDAFAEHGVADKADFKLSDGTTVPFDDESFTLVYSISVTQHVPREIVHGYLREAVRVLKPGGRAVFHFRNFDHVGAFEVLPLDLDASSNTLSCGWRAPEVREAGEAAGLVSEVHDIGLFLILVGHKPERAEDV